MLIAKPFGGATPAPTAVAVKPTPKATPGATSAPTPSPTARPTAAPTAKPTAKATPQPTAEPTPGPTEAPTPAPTFELTACRSDALSITVSYRADWFATSDGDTACLFIDRNPLPSGADTSAAAIQLATDDAGAADLLAAYKDTTKYVVRDSASVTVDGLGGYAIEVDNTGNGSDFPNGIRELLVFVNRPSASTLKVVTAGQPGDLFTENENALVQVVKNLQIDQ